jgi:signal transduction histidine kinase
MKQEVVTMVTNDLRSPLSTIEDFLVRFDKGVAGQLTPGGVQLVAAANRNVARMIALINDLLEIEKTNAGVLDLHQSEASLASIFEDTRQAVLTLASEHDVRIEIGKTDIVVNVDADQIIRVMINLVSNAIKFSPKHSTITVSAESTNGDARISVMDSGRGIPEHFLATVFTAFQQVKDSDAREKGGSGLGLAICKAIVELHGGTIGVESDEGKGSHFFFTLPKTKSSPRVTKES